MKLDHLKSALASPTYETFLDSLSRVGGLRDTPVDEQVLFIRELAALLFSAPISNRERSQRITSVVSVIRLDDEGLALLARELKSAPPEVKSVVSASIPVELRPYLYGSSDRSQSTSDTLPIPCSIPLREKEVRVEVGSRGVALLLATADQLANRSLLASVGVDALRVATIAEAKQILDTSVDVCVCLVDGSILGILSEDQQLELFHVLARYSSFMWLRVDESGLLLSPVKIQEILKAAWCRREDIGFSQLTCQPSGLLRQPELDCVVVARDLLSANKRGRFSPAELARPDAIALMAAVAEYARSWDKVTSIEEISLRTRFLRGGKTAATLVLLNVNDRRSPLVAKIGSQSVIVDEARRYRTFIADWDDGLAPKVHVHGPSGVILFGLVNDDDDPFNPAPTLEDRLSHLWWSELYPPNPSVDPPTPRNMVACITSVVDKLLSLNGRKCESSAFTPFADPNLDCFQHLEGKGISLGFTDDEVQARDRSGDRYSSLGRLAIVHGDVNLRNILVRGDRHGYLIDYANSGPGHPAVDLVRLELALYLGVFKQAGSEEECRQLQRGLSLEWDDWNDIATKYSALLRSQVNRVCIQGCVMARDAALAAVRSHGGTEVDYRAVKYLLAWQSLAVDGLQVGLARGVIGALAKGID